jgi:hypothetical protein
MCYIWAILTAYSSINSAYTTVSSFNVIEVSFKLNNFIVWNDRLELCQIWKLKHDMGNGGGTGKVKESQWVVIYMKEIHQVPSRLHMWARTWYDHLVKFCHSFHILQRVILILKLDIKWTEFFMVWFCLLAYPCLQTFEYYNNCQC